MTEEQFIARNESQWKQLEAYNTRLVRGGMRKWQPQDIRTFAALFRLTSYHMAYARTHYPHGSSLPYLNRVVGIAHNYFYIRETGGWAEIKRYFLRDFPEAVRRLSFCFFLSAALFMVGALFAGWYVSADTGRIVQILPADIINANGGISGGNDSNSGNSWDYPLMSAVIMTNNIRVSFTAFALGITAGAGTVAVLVYNGIVVGGLTAFLAQNGGDMLTFLSLLLPHGVLELTAIFLSGACGLTIGQAVLIPGPYARKHAVIKSAREAVVLIPGIILMLILAGLIEGFFTPLAIPAGIKLLFAMGTLVGLLLYMPRLKR